MSQTLDIVEEKDTVFMSIVEDVHEFGVEVKHDGMSLKQAQSIVRQARKEGYQARTQGLPNGNYQVVVDDRVVVENKQQWKLYQIVLPSKLGDVTVEDTLAEKAGVNLGTVLDFKRKHKQPLSRYLSRLKPIVIEDDGEAEQDLTELTETDIADMTSGMQSVFEPRAQMKAIDQQAYEDYLNPTGETPYSFGGDGWKFRQTRRVNLGGYKVA
jgi:hypothetical protein